MYNLPGGFKYHIFCFCHNMQEIIASENPFLKEEDRETNGIPK